MKRSKFGTFMYNFTTKIGFFLYKARPLYYLLNFTWGLIMVIIGLLVAFVMLISAHKPHLYHGTIYFRTRASNWGGLEIGMFFVVSANSEERLLMHEYGHTYQNAILGPFMLFLVTIPSAIRYWVRRIKRNKGIQLKKEYDAIWFEGGATDLGIKIVSYIVNKKEAKK